MAINYDIDVRGQSGDDQARQNYFKKFGYADHNAKSGFYENKFRTAADDFAAQFQQLVGRAPTADETGTYMGSVVGGSGLEAFGKGRGLELNQLTNNYIGSRFQDEAQKITETKLAGQQAESQRLSDLFRTQGNQAINSTEESLLNYQNKLFERLRPNLITSLQAQGLMNTGGLNQAIAGAQTDLATAGSEELRQQRLMNEQAANEIAYSGQAAPYQFQQQQYLNRPANLQMASQTGLQNAYGTFMNQLNFQNQQALMNQQASLNAAANYKSGGFFKQMGSALAPAFGQTLGANSASMLMPNSGDVMKAFGPAALASARKFKKDISKLTESEEDALYDRIVEMPVNRWRYKSEPESQTRHLGVMTDEALPEIVSADGDYLNTVDYLGALTVALKVQHRRFSRMEA
jgi:hypothetical protein